MNEGLQWIAGTVLSLAGCGTTALEPVPPSEPLLAEPPARPAEALAAEGEGVDFVFTSLSFGQEGLDGPLTRDAWSTLGYDLDGLASEPFDEGLCRPYGDAAPPSVHRDGVAGRDNAFAQVIVPLFYGLDTAFEAKVDAAMAAGERSHVLRVFGLADAADRTGLRGSLLLAGPSAEPLSWAVADPSLIDPADPTSARWSFDDGYVSGGTFVAYLDVLELRLPHDVGDIRLRVHRGRHRRDRRRPERGHPGGDRRSPRPRGAGGRVRAHLRPLARSLRRRRLV